MQQGRRLLAYKCHEGSMAWMSRLQLEPQACRSPYPHPIYLRQSGSVVLVGMWPRGAWKMGPLVDPVQAR